MAQTASDGFHRVGEVFPIRLSPQERAELAEAARRVYPYHLGTFIRTAALAEARRLAAAQAERSRPAVPPAPTAEELAELKRPARVALVACGKDKRGGRHPAAELYTGTLFRAARGYAEAGFALDGGWWILSARHGLVHPETELDGYEERLPSGPSKAARAARRTWAERVVRALRAELAAGRAELHVLAGADYTDPLAELLRAAGFKVVLPLAGLGIGQQRKRLAELTRGAAARAGALPGQTVIPASAWKPVAARAGTASGAEWVASGPAHRRAPAWVQNMTGLSTVGKIVAKYGDGARFQKRPGDYK